MALIAVIAACGGGGAPRDPTADTGPRDAGAPDALPQCTGDADCDDGVYCNGTETCARGRCAAGAPPDCDDGDPCTVDRCGEAARECERAPRDADGDGHGDAACGGDDCDDADALRFLGADEVCDPADRDEDCDPGTFGFRDADMDGFPDAACCNGDRCGSDCDDTLPAVHPTESESCNTLDDDCDGRVDEMLPVRDYCPDADGDDFGDATAMRVSDCRGPPGTVPNCTDCDDTRAAVNPGLFEICDSRDNDCDTRVDEETMIVDWYRDADVDGYGDPADTMPVASCAPVPGRAPRAGDCNDAVASIHPGASELCNDVDDDCNPATRPWDADGDGFDRLSCGARDCNDADPMVVPGGDCRLPHATSTCTPAGCRIDGCLGTPMSCCNHANCDGVIANGCEANLGADEATCGACGTSCTSSNICRSGTCTSPLCARPEICCMGISCP